MTIFIASLYLPKTVHYDLPEAPAQHQSTKPEPPPAKAKADELKAPPSLFAAPGAEPEDPKTPAIEQANPFTNLRLQIPSERPASRAGPADRSSPTWGSRYNQPTSRASSPPPSSLLQRTIQKAEELGRRGIVQPRHQRSESHDRVFQHARWRIASSDQGNGGLRNATDAAARDTSKLDDFMWVGTLGMPTNLLGNERKKEIEDKLVTEHDMLPIFCDDTDFDGHYAHYCKQILWPVFHYQIPDNPKSKAYEDHSWKHYEKVNQLFADAITRNWKRGDVVWVHDYHLLLVAGMVRKKIPDAKIGFFLHLAFPSSEIFRCLAMRNQLLMGMLGANLIGFHIHEYTRHFLQTCSRILNVEATPDGLELEDRFVNVTNLPIGIDPLNLVHNRKNEHVMQWVSTLRERYQGMKLIVGRDKLDHVRGVRQKLLSYELFLNQNPEWRGKVVLVQVALSTSEKLELDATVSDIVVRLNSTWANLSYQPIVYLKQDIAYSQYLALLAMADALFITTQREGMNLTSHEFIFCQDGKIPGGKKHGSLILSEFAGTASLFGEYQLSVNPWDYRACANAIKTALEMSDEEKERRWKGLYEAAHKRTGAHWCTEMLSRLDRVYEEQHRRDNTVVPRLSLNNLVKRYKQSSRRLFLLDYEGTLVNWGPVNKIISVSPQRPLVLLHDLLLDPANTIYIMSGRRPEELDRLFKKKLGDNVGFIAENGCFLKDVGSDSWTEMADPEHIRKWKQSMQGILTYYLERTPGAEVEELRCSLIFHYNNAEDYELASRQAAECAAHINDSCEKLRVHAIPIDGSIIVEPIDWTKSTAAVKIFDDLEKEITKVDDSTPGKKTPVDFLMVVGDGREDEPVFKWANGLAGKKKVADVVTVSVGNRSTEAKAALAQGVSGVLAALDKLVQS